ncbi:hypothetical protein QBC33DRAFT_541618 [Phialemonium atrogriseum]|uniref:F-box domain-containing protein n=1 Tax=Phialemonium atrogriseum TaxID=1093897 RepID=A0AAJ0FMZ0_9PEZI|nr:uncharacterized protein QBC33DRAFT_541618 [Phialemonium atrogriseum]KAK1766635.1 hypothetical protein QBC33DRAFT_541618 [Phialemonium atrogriseum]
MQNYKMGSLRARDRLSDLPDGLLMLIFEEISKRDLCNVSHLNKRCHGLADSILYRTVLFESPEHHLIFRESLSRRLRRGSAIRDITVKLDDTTSLDTLELSQLVLDGSRSDVDGLSRAISTMSNLENLDISVPGKFLRGIGTLFNGPFDLACLKSCTLFYQCPDNQYWDLRDNIHIFAHPTLQSLVIRRAKLDHRGFDFIEQPHQTGLKKLHLIECDINDDALYDILAFPESLREFVMVQTPEPTPDLEESSDNIGDYILALRSASHSIETITIDFPTLTGFKALRMREFEALKTLRINWDYQLFGKSSKKPRLHSVGIPPVLERLEFFNELGTDEEVTELLEYTILNKSVMARNLERIIVPEGDTGRVPKVIVEACKAAGLQLDVIGALDVDTDDEEQESKIDA